MREALLSLEAVVSEILEEVDGTMELMCGKTGVLHSIDNCKTVFACCPACGLMTRAYKGHEKARLAWNTRAAVEMEGME